MNYNKQLHKICDLKYFLFLPIISYSIFIIYLSSLSAIPYIISHFDIKDKILHCIGFLGYGILLFLPIFCLMQNSQNHQSTNDIEDRINNPEKDYSNIQLNKSYVYTFIISFTFAISDEIHQSFVPGRNSDIYDLVADTLGILSSLLIYHLIFKLLVPKLKTNYTK